MSSRRSLSFVLHKDKEADHAVYYGQVVIKISLLFVSHFTKIARACIARNYHHSFFSFFFKMGIFSPFRNCERAGLCGSVHIAIRKRVSTLGGKTMDRHRNAGLRFVSGCEGSNDPRQQEKKGSVFRGMVQSHPVITSHHTQTKF